MPKPLPRTFGEVYAPAMKVQSTVEAEALLSRLVDEWLALRAARRPPLPEVARDVAESRVRSDIAYYAGYYGEETRRRVERCFRTAHPILGPIGAEPAPQPEVEA